jgi:hypothetical protein
MDMDRRGFLKMFGGATGGIVVATTMAQAGMWAEFMSWLKRAPAWSFPSRITVQEDAPLLFDNITATTLESLRDSVVSDNFFVDSPFYAKLRYSVSHKTFKGGETMRSPIYYEPIALSEPL